MKINMKEYDNVKIGTAEQLKAGGHKCIIKNVSEGLSKTGKDMLIIGFDTAADDRQPGFYTNDYLLQASNQKWRGNHYLVMGTEYSMKNLKQFIGAVEASNEGFKGITEEGIVKTDELTGKKVGIVFRPEEYLANTGRIGTSIKSFYFCNYEDALDKEIPEKKALAPQKEAFASPDPMAASEGFMSIPDAVEDDGLPFA